MSSAAEIATELKRRIESGQLKPGAKVLSARQITRRFGVAIATASKALAMLKEEGWVRAVPGVGTIVDPGLSKDRIVKIALKIADAEGLEAVSMRRIAYELGVSTMSLYRHLSNKEDLLLLVADAAFAEHPPPSSERGDRDWRAQLERVARAQWQGYRRHPWLASALSMTRPQLTPHGMKHTEHLLAVLDGHGLSDETMLVVALTLIGYVRGLATSLEMEAEAEHESGIDSEAFMEAQDGDFRAVAASGAFPHLLRVVDAPKMDLSLDRLFEFGLARMLDGFAAVIEKTEACLSVTPR